MNNFKLFFLAVIFNCYKLNVLATTIYNAGAGKCLKSSGIPNTPITLGDCYSKEAIWDLPAYFNGHCYQFTYRLNPNYCFGFKNNIPTLVECSSNSNDSNEKNVVCFNSEVINPKYEDMNKYFGSSGSTCLAPSESDPKQLSFIECSYKDGNLNTIWYNNYPYDTDVYIYNAYRNKCLRTTGIPDSPLTYGACDHSDNTVWKIPKSHNGNFRSQVNLDYCISIEDGVLSLKECNDDNTIYRDGNFVKSTSSDNYCISLSEKTPNEAILKECDINNPDQIWFFNLWDSSDVVIEVEDTPVIAQPETVTIYFYNAYRNSCITSDGDAIVNGKCFNNDNALWEIPASHDGYYRSKVNPEKCLSVVDGVVTLSECNENTKLYRDGNFIRSPLSDAHCIASSVVDNSIEYVENCIENHSDYIWYFNIWTPPAIESTPEVANETEVVVPTEVANETEVVVPTEVANENEVVVPTEVANETEVVVPTEVANENEVVVPTEVANDTEVVVPTEVANDTEVVVPTTAAEEKPTMTIITTVTAIMTEA